MKVAIDIGHARMTGSRGCDEEEHELCARMAPLLQGALEAYGVEADVIDFPEMPNDAEFVRATQEINVGGYDLSVSLHCDANDKTSARGAHVCYVSSEGRRLAEAIAKHLCPLMPGRADRTVRRPGLYVLAHTRPVAVLVETGFITNPDDCARLVGDAAALMEAVAAGVHDYLNVQ